MKTEELKGSRLNHRNLAPDNIKRIRESIEDRIARSRRTARPGVSLDIHDWRTVLIVLEQEEDARRLLLVNVEGS